MNRIFHARIAWYQYFALALFTVNAVAALWCKYILPAVFMVLLLIVLIEQIIHTVYTVTSDGTLIIHQGRFSRKKVIPISKIGFIEQCHSMKFGWFSVTRYVLIKYDERKYEALMPVKEQEFMQLIEKRMLSEKLDSKR